MRARKRNLTRHTPRPFARVEFAFELRRVLVDTAATNFFQFFRPREFLGGQPIFVVDEAVGIRQRNDLRAKLQRFLNRVQRDVSRSRNHAGLALKRITQMVEHVLDEVDAAVPRRLRTNQAAAIRQTLAGQHAGDAPGDAPVLAVQISNLSAADPDVSRRHVDVVADVSIKLAHHRLAEPHHLVV